ncbi:MAG TPA: phenylalanine--tRNA ligase subunit beta [Solirubrobacteraceae bacterium]|jgi:phenylalanyl-tRNA synthetase beta chain|nr:phenylalanine--tRNA ligase subunit beta [Solirubrobacteraceae bacterium]
MKVPLNWLREYCSPDLDTAAIEERLTMTGTKVETILHHGVPSVENFVVGRVLTAEPHPDADRLKVCTVDVGQGESAGIVCGAPNVAAGQTVAVALPGARMPDGTKIKAAKLRGVPSNGMILAADELEIDNDHSGIMVLDELILDAGRSEIPSISDRLAPGTPLADVLAISTDVLELEITPNRPDCLGVYGVARELHAATGAPLAPEPWGEDLGSSGPLVAEAQNGGASPVSGEASVLSKDDAPRARGGQGLFDVTVECPDLCPRFTARAFEDVTIGPSPPWLKARLSAAGQRPINNVVDITNYVMLLCAQPLHAFDLDRVAGAKLTVRRAHDGEQVTTLDGQTRTLDGEMVVIEDGEGPTSIAGIMGGERSEVQAETKRVLMEVANWSGSNIHRTSWALGLRSEASSRFEKGLAPEQCMYAQALATRLMVELCGARVLPGTIDTAPDGPPPQTIRLREQRVQAILGMPVASRRQAEILRALDFAVAEVGEPADPRAIPSASAREGAMQGAEPGANGQAHAQAGGAALDVTVPPVRREDVTREADLIEEVARIHGLAALPATLPARRGAYGRLSTSQQLRRRAADALVGRGLYEAVGWTFTAPTLHDRLRLPEDDQRRRAPVVENPLSDDQSLLRTTLLGSLLDVAAHNCARGMVDFGLFEIGTLFVLDGDTPAAHTSVGAAEDGGTWAQTTPAGAERETGSPGAGSETGVREHQSLAVLFAGKVLPATWGAPDPPCADVFAVKGVLEALGAALRVELECLPGAQPFLHPGRSAAVLCDGQELGWLGELHPLVAREWGIESAAAMELQLDLLLDSAEAQSAYRDVISYPALRQDLAVVLAEDVAAAEVLDAVRGAAGGLLDEVGVFDVYSGPQVGEGRRSLALSLAFRAPDRTLTDEDVAPVRERVVAALAALGGELRA